LSDLYLRGAGFLFYLRSYIFYEMDHTYGFTVSPFFQEKELSSSNSHFRFLDSAHFPPKKEDYA